MRTSREHGFIARKALKEDLTKTKTFAGGEISCKRIYICINEVVSTSD